MALFNCISATGDGLCVENRKSFLLFFYTICYLAYIALGGLCFLVLEGPQESAQHRSLLTSKGNFLKKYPCVSEDALNEFLNEMTSFRIRSWNTPNSTAKWTYGEAVFFSVTLLTTIGYGHITPVSPVGKVVCMIYAGLGIPLTLILLAAYVQRLMQGAVTLRKTLCCCLEQALKPFVLRFIHFIIILISIILLFFVLPAFLFDYLEDGWTLLDAFYFCFISLTTVGLGDYVPGLDPNQPYVTLYRFGVTLYIIIGVTTMMFMMSLTAELQQSLSRQNHESLHVYQGEKIPIAMRKGKDVESYGTILIHKIIDNKKEKDHLQPS